MSNKIVYVFIVVILFATPVLMAQETSTATVTNQLWLDFNPKWQISERLDVRGKVGAKSNYPRLWRKLYTTAEISYSIPKNIFKKLQYNERAYAGIDF